MEEAEIRDIPTLVIPDNLFNSTEFQIRSEIVRGEPKPNPELGFTKELNDTKNRITPHADAWEKSIKFLISDFELIDIHRNPKYSHQRYNEPIIKYRQKLESDESKGRYPIFSRAYFKLWEVLGNSDVLAQYEGKELTVGNVAEGPGGFIHCLIDFRKKQNGLSWNKDSYHGITLKIPNDGKAHALDWDWQRAKEYFTYVKNNHSITLSYGADGSGNMFKLDNLDHYINNDLKNKKCQLVTGDGGLDLSGDDEFNKQEVANAALFFAEITYCLHVQEEGGCFVLKIYDVYLDVTVELILLLRLFYTKVTIIKPHTSRPASSEKYLVCEGFKGIKPEQLQLLRDLLAKWVGNAGTVNILESQNFAESVLEFDLVKPNIDTFKNKLADFNKIFSDYQIKKINDGLELAENAYISNEKTLEIKKNQKELAIVWCKTYNQPYLEDLELTKSSGKTIENQGYNSKDNRYQNYNSRHDSRSDNRNNDYRNRYSNRDRSDNHRNRYDDRNRYDNQRHRDRRRSRSRSREREKSRSIRLNPEDRGDEEKRKERENKFGKI